MIDSHCHLADEVFEADLPAVIERTRAAGVTDALVIVAAGDAAEEDRAARLAAAWPGARFAVGVHPHQARECAGSPGRATSSIEAARRAVPRVAAIGEIGLDYHYDFSPRDVQREVFVEQIAAARACRLPIVIHTREADADTFDVLASEGRGDLSGVFHCFTGDAARARRALDLGFHVSFAGILTFPKAADVREAATIVPDDRLLIETDSPFLAPVPHRGRRNEPAHVGAVAEALAVARGSTPEAIRALTAANFLRLFPV